MLTGSTSRLWQALKTAKIGERITINTLILIICVILALRQFQIENLSV